MKTEEQRDEFLILLLGTLGASLLKNLVSGKGLIWAFDRVIRAGNRMEDNLIKFEIQWLCVYSRNDLAKLVKDE